MSSQPGMLEPQPADASDGNSAQRRLSRSPHPYSHLSGDLRDPRYYTSRPTILDNNTQRNGMDYFSAAAPGRRRQHARTSSDSGTEADDEKPVLKALTAPPLRLRKGLRDEIVPGFDLTSPLPTPSLADDSFGSEGPPRKLTRTKSTEESAKEAIRRQKRKQGPTRAAVYARRATEILLLGLVGAITFAKLPKGLQAQFFLHVLLAQGLYMGYLFRLARRLRAERGRRKRRGLPILPSFDVAPLLYPFLVPVLVALSLKDPSVAEANFVLSICTLPLQVLPSQDIHIHWLLSLLPLVYRRLSLPTSIEGGKQTPSEPEVLALLLPLHCSLISCLEFLTTTSLLPTEVQLLSVGLINLMLFAEAPQAFVLKALIWIGGIALLCTCRHVLKWTVSLARVPKWRFRKVRRRVFRNNRLLAAVDDTVGGLLSGWISRAAEEDSDSESDDGGLRNRVNAFRNNNHRLGRVATVGTIKPTVPESPIGTSIDDIGHRQGAPNSDVPQFRGHARRYTLPAAPSALPDIPQLRRTATEGLAKFRDQPKHYLSLTSAQATLLKWLYAGYVYVVTVITIMGPIRLYVIRRALDGEEPFGWALGYLFGGLPSFRLQVVLWRLEGWICLPPYESDPPPDIGRAEYLRSYIIGRSNSRLFICAYCLSIIFAGVTIVMHLSKFAEVDTRRKVFHGMMVAMFGVTIFVDPSLISLAFVLILVVFLLLDLFRASQLPPVSKPLTMFLTPYVDGRDFKGPVVVSHIFLLTGCAVPFWLSLAALQRDGDGAFSAWEIQYREVSMITGVVCVGMGDAAASLIGRRFGRRRWAWGGGKSLEGSLAFAVAVAVGLVAARVYLIVGGWPVANHDAWPLAILRISVAGCATSLTEAVLTGANDNVLVPIILWLWVRALGL